MDKTNIKIEFSIVSDIFDIDLLNKALGMKPDNYWNKGERIDGRNIKRKQTNWEITTNYIESLDVNEEMEKLIVRIKEKVNELIDFKKMYDVDYVFCAIINIENHQTPAIYLEKETINFLSSINASFEVDMYLYS